MLRRTGVLIAVLTLFTAACSSGENNQRVATVAPKKATTTTELATTTTTAGSAAAQVMGSRVQRVRQLPAAERPERAPKAAPARRSGPTPTGRIEIPRIGLNHLTYEGIDLATIDHGPSHWPGTALPGQNGNAVYPGHRVTHSRPFYNIDLIQVGDEVTFINSSGRYTYKVTQTFVVDDEEMWIADQTANPTMTIFGCHPKHSARQRYVVKGDLIKSDKTANNAEPAAPSPHGDGGDGNYTTAPDPAAPPETTTTTAKPRGLGGILGGG